MNPAQAKQLINSCIEKGWVKRGLRLYTPLEAKKLNIEADKKNKSTKGLKMASKAEPRFDPFRKLCEIELGVLPYPEYRFDPKRKWRIDYAFIDYKLALEVEGGVWKIGRHNRPKGFLGDMEKYNSMVTAGWKLIRCQPDDLMNGKAIELIKQILK